MIPKDLFEKVRRIEITTSRLVTDVFAGQYHSVFKGRGMEFDEVREYQHGDDIRSIDWNVTARTGVTHIKKYIEERELTVMIMVDLSRSCRFATVNELKSKLAAEIAAVLAFAAIRNNDKVGLIMFTSEVEKFIPPRKGSRHVLRVIREVLYFEPQKEGTDLSKAVDYLNKVATRKAVTFIISDFFEARKENEEPSFKRSMTIANKKHDIVAITLNDPLEISLPDCGLIELEDAENNETIVVDSSQPQVRKQYERHQQERLRKRDLLFRSMGVDHIDISTDVPFSDALVKFFLQRKRIR